MACTTFPPSLEDWLLPPRGRRCRLSAEPACWRRSDRAVRATVSPFISGIVRSTTSRRIDALFINAQRGASACDRNDIVALCRKGVPHQFQHRGIIIAYEKRSALAPFTSLRPGALDFLSDTCARGNHISILVPRPGTLCRRTAPPDCVTTPCIIESPRPVPSPAGLVVKNGSVARLWLLHPYRYRCPRPLAKRTGLASNGSAIVAHPDHCC